MIPGLIAIGIVELIACRTGAMTAESVEAVARLQHKDPDIVWTGPGNQYGPLALARVQIEHPDILMIGHSRCGQMRSMMFKPYRFQNACVVAWTFGQIKNMIDLATRTGGPKTIIFTLDYFMLGDVYAKKWEDRAFMDFSSPQRGHLDALRDLASMFKSHPVAMTTAMPSYLAGRVYGPDGLEFWDPTLSHYGSDFALTDRCCTMR